MADSVGADRCLSRSATRGGSGSIVAIRQAVAKLVAVRCGISEKSLATYKSALRAALVWYAKKADISSRGTPLDKTWSALSSAVSNLRDHINLFALMRYCSARRFLPGAVDDTVLRAFVEYRRATTFLDCSRSRCGRSPVLGIAASPLFLAGRNSPHRADFAGANKGPGLGGLSCGLSC